MEMGMLRLVVLCCSLVACSVAQVQGKTCVPCPDCAVRCLNATAKAVYKGVNPAYPSSTCGLDANDFGVVAPILIPPATDACERRRNAVELYAFQCPFGTNANINFYVEDSTARIDEATDPTKPDLRTFNMLVFTSRAEADNYKNNCPGPFSILNGTEGLLNAQCLNFLFRQDNYGAYSSTDTLVVLAECTRTDKACNMSYVMVKQCWVDNTKGTAIPGLILGILALLGTVWLFFWRRSRKIPVQFDVGALLLLLALTSAVVITYWALVLVDNTTNELSLSLSIQIQWSLFWLDKVILVLANLTLVLLLFQWAVVIHDARERLLKRIFIGFGIGLVVFLLGTMIPYSRITTVSTSARWTHILLQVFLSVSFAINLLLTVALLVYGIWLLRLQQRSKASTGREAVYRFVFLLAVLMIVSLARIAAASAANLRFLLTEDTLLWVIYNVLTVKFPSEADAIVYNVFVLILPYAVPCFAVIFILFVSSYRVQEPDTIAVPLIERYADQDPSIPVRYSI